MEQPAPSLSLRRGQGCAIGGCAVAAMAIWIAPLLLGPIAALLGVVAMARGERRGQWVIVAAVVATLLGLLLNLLPEKFASS